MVNNEKSFKTLSQRITFKDAKIINENLVGVEMKRVNVLLNKPIYLGACILDLSKLQLYDFYYNHIISQYGNSTRLLYLDTDALVLQIFCDDFYRDMQTNAHIYDISNYPPSHFLYNMSEQNTPGLWKDKAQGRIITSFVVLGAKAYSYVVQNGVDEVVCNKAKGVKQYVVKGFLHDDYVKCLSENHELKHSFNTIRSYNHKVYPVRQTKKPLSCFDDKRYYVNPYTIAYGHYKINKRESDSKTNHIDKKIRRV